MVPNVRTAFIVHIYMACGMNEVTDSELGLLHCIIFIIISYYYHHHHHLPSTITYTPEP